jgi:hypothetical protein
VIVYTEAILVCQFPVVMLVIIPVSVCRCSRVYQVLNMLMHQLTKQVMPAIGLGLMLPLVWPQPSHAIEIHQDIKINQYNGYLNRTPTPRRIPEPKALIGLMVVSGLVWQRHKQRGASRVQVDSFQQ